MMQCDVRLEIVGRARAREHIAKVVTRRKCVPENFIQRRHGTGARVTDVSKNSILTFLDILYCDRHHGTFLKQTNKHFMKKKFKCQFMAKRNLCRFSHRI
jgi:hypothetical protein